MNTEKGRTNAPIPDPDNRLILPRGLSQWLTEDTNVKIDVLAYLMRNPADFAALAVLARLETDGAGLLFTPNSDRAAEVHEARQRAVREWCDTGHLAACPWCVAPVVAFGNGIFIDLRPREHNCEARRAA